MPAETNINNSGNTAVVPVSRSLLSKVSPAASSLLSSPVVRIISKSSLSATSLLSTKVSITNNKTMTTKLCVSTPTSTSNGVNSRTTMPALTTRVVTRTNTVKLPFDIDQGDEEVPPLSSASSTNDANNNREDGGGDDSDVEEELSNFFSKLDQSIKKNPNSHNQRISNVINRSGPGIQVVRATQRSILNLSGANHRTTLISKLSSITPTTRFTRILPRPSIPNSASHSPVTLNKSTLPIKITLNASSSGTTFSSVTPTVTGTIRKINIAPASSSNASSKSASNITTVQKNGTTSTPQKTPCFIVLSDGNNVRLKATDVKQLIQLKAASATSNTRNINIPTTGSSVITSKQLSIATLKKAPIGTTSPQVIQVKLQPKPKPEPEIVKVERPKEPETTQTLPVKEEFVDSEEEEEEVQLIESVPQQKEEEEEQIVKPSDLLEVKLEEEEERQVNLVPEEREEDRISSPFDLDRTFWPDNSRIFDCDIPNLELLPAEALPPVPDFDDDSDYENYCDLIKPQVLVRVEGDSEQEEEEADNSEEELQIDEDYRPDEDQVKPSTSAFGTSYVNEPIDSECRAATDKGQFIIGQTVPHQRVHLHPGFALIVKSALNGQNQLTTVTSTGTTAATSTNNFTLINKSTPTTTFSTTTIGTSAYASTSILQTKSLPDGTKAIYTLAKVQPGTSNNNGIVSSANATGQSRVIKVINSQSGKTQPIIVKSVSQGNTAAGLPSGVKLVTLSKTSSFVTSNTASTPTNTLAPSTTSTTSSASGSKLNSRPFIIQVENNDGTMATTLALMLNQGSSAGNSSSTNKLITSPANSANTTTTSPASVGSSLLHRAAQIGASSTLANSLKNMTGFTTAAIAHSLNEYAYEATNDDIRMFLPGRQQPNSPQSIHNNSTVGNLVAGLPTSADLESLNKMDRECVNCGTTNTSQWRTNGNGHYLCNACGLYKKYNGEDRPPASIQQPRKRTNQAPKQCSNCGTLTSSMWRRTANKQVACNACGLYYKLYGVNRPIEMRKDIVYPRNRYSKLNGQTKNGASQSGASPKQNEREPVTYAKQQQAQQVKIQQASAVQQQRQYYASNIRTLHHSPEHVPQTASYMIGPDNKVLSNNSNNSTGTQQPKIIVISGNNKATILQNGVNFGSVLSPNTMLNTNQHQTAPPTSTPTIVTPTAMSSIVSNHNEIVSSSSPPQQQQYLTLKSSPGRNSPNETNIKQEPDDDDDVCTLEDSQDENSLLPQEDAEIIKMEPEILMHDNIKDELDDNGQELSPVSAVANAAAAAAAAAAASAPFQSLLELSALTANNPAAAQTQAALISAIIQSGSFPMQQDPTQLGSLLANSALAAVFQATANALSNGTFGAAAAAAVGLEGLTNGKGFVDGLNGSNGHHLGAVKGYTSPQPQECANCGTVSSTTQLRRYGNLAHYLCGKCTANSNHHVTQAAAAILNAASNNNSTPQQNRKNSDANSSDGDSHATSGRKAHSGRKVKTRDVQCTNCGVTKSSEWRRNVRGEIVCNACGLYYKLHNRDRPIHMRRDFIAHRKRTPNTNSQKIQAMKRLNEVNAENPVMDDYEGKNMIRLISGDQKKVQMIAIDASQQNAASPVHRISPPTSVRSVIHESGNSNSNFDDDEEIPIDDDLDEEGSSVKRIKLEHHHNQNTTDTEYSVPDSPTMNDCASVASSSGCSVETENTISSGCGSAVTSGGGKKRKQSNPKRVIAAAHSENNVTGTEETEVELEPEEDSVHSS